ncbi:MAG: hypothetical protein GFH27_549309n48 [Chloroflexi bacterium AL-W]|nr:hypothetical protein [Chloroflexi bacterium AL-N1]NOK69751.1 hypothetical protein [Chloroflexi bacterium AL-N10]NOK73645.1 hypothetical protein [Chloroflexi bacterium AL-N5]NOK83921.1 hypothetical protein [Chloroflexi bacterium AL-W]NOK87976.1 hypothetical protein [Chloroflexi bacterium AL-N15]
MHLSYGLAFCIVVIGYVFALSSFAKLKDLSTYIKSVSNFRLLPPALVLISAIFFLLCEMLTAILLVFWPMAAFALAATMLTLFSIALASVLIRRIDTTCNCFGASNNTISGADLVRNAGLFICACAGLYLTIGTYSLGQISLLEWIIIGVFGSVVVMLWTQLGEIWRLLAITLQPN